LKIKNNLTIGVIIIVLLFFFILFGLPGLKLIIGIGLLYVLPFFLILDRFDLEKTEKIVFSFFIGIGIFPSIVYYLGIIFNSIRIAIVVTFIILIAIGLLLKKLLPVKK